MGKPRAQGRRPAHDDEGGEERHHDARHHRHGHLDPESAPPPLAGQCEVSDVVPHLVQATLDLVEIDLAARDELDVLLEPLRALPHPGGRRAVRGQALVGRVAVFFPQYQTLQDLRAREAEVPQQQGRHRVIFVWKHIISGVVHHDDAHEHAQEDQVDGDDDRGLAKGLGRVFHGFVHQLGELRHQLGQSGVGLRHTARYPALPLQRAIRQQGPRVLQIDQVAGLVSSEGKHLVHHGTEEGEEVPGSQRLLGPIVGDLLPQSRVPLVAVGGDVERHFYGGWRSGAGRIGAPLHGTKLLAVRTK